MDLAIIIIEGIVGTAAVTLLGALWRNRKRLMLLCGTQIKRNQRVRVSAAYLFRIMINGKYLLVKGKRIATQYQPIGGVYRRYESAQVFFEKMDVLSDEGMSTCKDARMDLRVTLPRKNLLSFLDWFDARQNREVALQREFYEEMIVAGPLSVDALTSFSPEYVKCNERKIHYSKHFGMHELLLHEVYELKLSKAQEKAILKYIEESDSMILASAQEIMRQSISIDNALHSIGEHATLILGAS